MNVTEWIGPHTLTPVSAVPVYIVITHVNKCFTQIQVQKRGSFHFMHKSENIVMVSVLAIKALKVGEVAEQTKEDNGPP